MREFVRTNPTADHAMMFDFRDCANKGFRKPWTFLVMGCDILVT